MNLMKRFRSHIHTTVDGTGLALFRITYSTVLLFEVIQLFYFRQLIFDTVPFQDGYVIDFTLALLAWMVIIVALIFGYRTRTAAIGNYLMSLVFFAVMRDFEYHMMYTYMGTNFLLMFLPLDRRLSLDNLRRRRDHDGDDLPETSFRVSKFAYTWTLFMGIGLVYLDSVLYKTSSPIWMAGLGMWYPASLANFAHVTWQGLLNQGWLMMTLGYVTVAFEATFPFLLWFRKLRWPLLIVGIGLHIGILVFFPIPWFALGVCAVYTLLVPSTAWERARQAVCKWNQRSLTAYYDRANPAHCRTRAFFSQFDLNGNIAWQQAHVAKVEVNGKHGTDAGYELARSLAFGSLFAFLWKAPGPRSLLCHLSGLSGDAPPSVETPSGLTTEPGVPRDSRNTHRALLIGAVLLVLLQINASMFSPWGKMVRDTLRLDQLPGVTALQKAGMAGSKAFFGITRHPVFMDSHYSQYNHIIAVVHVSEDGDETWLPMIDEDGAPSFYIYGANWVHFTFRVNNGHLNQDLLSEGLERYTTFWAHKNDVPLGAGRFEVRVKYVDLPPTQWIRDFLINQRDNPWQPAGTLAPNEQGLLEADLADIESIGPVEKAGE